MTHQEEMIVLRKYPKHYLWNKRRRDWTPEDLKSFNSLSADAPLKLKKRVNNYQPVIQHKDGHKIEYASVIEASIKSGVSKASIYAVVNGHSQTAGGCKWEKVINN
jgi:hypothetical protein